MTEDLSNKIGIFHRVDYIPKSLKKNNPRLNQDSLDTYADRYVFGIILVINCQNCDFMADYSRTWESQSDNIDLLRAHYVAEYKIIVDLKTRIGKIAKHKVLDVENPEIHSFPLISDVEQSLDDCILDFVRENKSFFREETQKPPKIPERVLRYIVDNCPQYE